MGRVIQCVFNCEFRDAQLLKTMSGLRVYPCLGNRYNERLVRRKDRSEHSATSLPASHCCGLNVEGYPAIGWILPWTLTLARYTELGGRALLNWAYTAPFALNNRRDRVNPLRRTWTIGQGGRKPYRVGSVGAKDVCHVMSKRTRNAGHTFVLAPMRRTRGNWR